MILCINCNKQTKEKMDELLSDGHYRDYSELVTVAIDNLCVISSEVGKKGALVIDDHSALHDNQIASPLNKKNGTLNARKISRQNRNISETSKTVTPTPIYIPDLFIGKGLDNLSPETIALPIENEINKIYTLDRWLFGQFNKLLPIKANCRALTRLAMENKDGIRLISSSIHIAKAALLLGDYLADHDRLYQTGRDDALSTAFPRSGHRADKSLSRYANQFVGYVNMQNILSGLLSDYRMAGLVSEKELLILPTEQAVHFARFPNPILDGFQTVPNEKFSTEETSFLLEHIRSTVPAEAFAFRTLIKTITEGADTPDKLDEALRTLIPINSNRSFSQSFLTSQRSGALSRMADIGLIIRVRSGVRVSYAVTEQANRFMESTETSK